MLAVQRGFRGPDEADCNALVWALEPDGLDRLATTIEWLYSELPGELAFEATWGAEPGRAARLARRAALA